MLFYRFLIDYLKMIQNQLFENNSSKQLKYKQLINFYSQKFTNRPFINFLQVKILLLQNYYNFKQTGENQMCGICFILGGAPIQNHDFTNFNFFQSYLCKNNVALNEHIMQNKLMLPLSFQPNKVMQKISKRGPDYFQVNQIDMFKINSHELKIQCMNQNVFSTQGIAHSFQSILHLRGKQIYTPKVPGTHFLYNGEIWDTGSLQPIQTQQNDSEWFHQRLLQAKGSKQKINQILQQIRGDFAFIFIEGDEIFIGKDFYGKRSLLLGMGENYLVVTSAPIHNFGRIMLQQNADQAQDQDAPQTQQSWRQKYEAEWLSSKNKNYFQIPSNCLINIVRDNSGKLIWNSQQIQKINLSQIPKQINQVPDQQILSNIKKLLIQSLKQISRCIYQIGQTPQTKIAVLFSGGIDSTLIARLLDFILPKNQTIDLVNLAFRADAPDRESGLQAYKQLKNLSPHRNYNLILLDKKLEDVEAIKQELMQTIYPKTTHMDFNIAGALRLAASGTKSKIILTGLGADEIFSGYSRYRIAFKRAGLEQLQRQMIFDMERLWIRNLGRDDRSLGGIAKQVRYPFLYLPLWTYLRSLPISSITDGAGQKKLLRKIALDFGLELSSKFKKRAIQFGTRLAKLSNVKCFGSNRKAKGTHEYQ